MKNKQDRVKMQFFYSDVNSRPTIRRGEYKAIFLLERRKTVICNGSRPEHLNLTSFSVNIFSPNIITSLSQQMFVTCFWNRLLLVGGWSQLSRQDQQSPKWPIRKISTRQLIILELAYLITFKNQKMVVVVGAGGGIFAFKRDWLAKKREFH